MSFAIRVTERAPRASTNVLSLSSKWMWGVIGVGVAVGLVSPHPFLSTACWLVLPFLIHLVSFENEVPIFSVGLVVLWIKTTLPVIYFSGFRGLSLDSISSTYSTFFQTTPKLDAAIWFSLGAVVVLAIGVRFAVRRYYSLKLSRLHSEAGQISVRKAFFVYIFLYIFDSVISNSFFLQFGGLSQSLIALKFVRWSLFFIISYVVMLTKKDSKYLFFAILIEITFGVLGYWGGFRDFLYIYIIAYLLADPTLKSANKSYFIVLITSVVVTGLFWQTVKSEYRHEITGGQSMRVKASRTQQAALLADMAQRITWKDITDSIDGTVERISVNVFFFGEVLEYVPEHRPYDEGAGWWRGIQHVIKPRLFFPDKPALNDSKITNRYIMGEVSETTASFSIGYIGESYADFGPFFMYIPIFIVGFGFGCVYIWFRKKSKVKIIGISLCCSFLIYRIVIPDDIPSLLGLVITHSLVMALLLIIFEKKIADLISKR